MAVVFRVMAVDNDDAAVEIAVAIDAAADVVVVVSGAVANDPRPTIL